MRISDTKLKEIDEISAPFYAEEYFRKQRDGEEMTIYEIVDLIHTNTYPHGISLIYDDEVYHKSVVKATIYSTLVHIAKNIYHTYGKG